MLRCEDEETPARVPFQYIFSFLRTVHSNFIPVPGVFLMCAMTMSMSAKTPIDFNLHSVFLFLLENVRAQLLSVNFSLIFFLSYVRITLFACRNSETVTQRCKLFDW